MNINQQSTTARPCRVLLGVVALFSLAAPASAGTVESNVVWIEGKPQLDVVVRAEVKEIVKEVALPVELLDAQNTPIWTTVLKVPVTGGKAWQLQAPLQNIKDEKKQHRLKVALLDAGLDIDYSEEITFAAENAAVQTSGLRTQGVFPSRKVFFTLGLNAFKGREFRDLPVTLGLRDGDDNLVLNRQAVVKPAGEARRHVLDVTPEAGAVGPFRLEVGIESEGYSVFFNSTYRFGHANGLVPFTSFEHGDPAMWFAADGNPASYRSLELYAPGQEQLYYSEHLRDLLPRDNPKVTYDRAEKHTGWQSLRLDYLTDREAHAWSTHYLPGKPLMMTFWVKGNDSKDQLLVHFEDNVNYTAQAWQRRAQFSTVVAGTLDFTGWRRFRVPVLGNGLQVTGLKGSTEKIDAPIRLMAFTIKPAPAAPGKPKEARRTIWIDDLSAETQVPAAERLSLELQGSEPHGRLTPDGILTIAAGNGYTTDLKKGRCKVVASDGGNNPVWTRTIDLAVPGEGYAVAELPLAELAQKKPRGPVDIDVTFEDPSQAGARLTRRYTLKAAGQGGLVFDFEEPVTYSGFQPGKVVTSQAKVVPGGAEGSAHALMLPVLPGATADNSVLFHPALPGMVDSIEMMVQGGERPTTLQVWFIDSGYTGIWIRPYNLFYAEPIQVDWQGWRKVVVPAPPVPAYYGDKQKYFYRRPWYPLNLAVSAKVDGDKPTEVRFDNIRVLTHLPEQEQLRLEVEYPDESRIHPPGAPLRLSLTNFAAEPARLNLTYKLTNYRGIVAHSGQQDVTLSPGSKTKLTLQNALAPGIYDLEVNTGKEPIKACIMVLNVKDYFGDDPAELLTNAHLLRRSLNLMTERIYLDWDNTEGAPYLYHFNWFEQEVKKRREIYQLPKHLLPLAAIQTATAAAVVKGEADLKTAQDQVTAAKNAQKPANDKAAMTLKQLETGRLEADAAGKVFDASNLKATAAAKEALTAKEKQADVLKALQKADADAKTAKDAVATAEKSQRDKETAVKDAEAKLKVAQDAQAAADKNLAQAEAALKGAEKENVPKKIDEAKAKVAEAKKAAEAAKLKTAEALKVVEAGKADVLTAKAAVEVAKVNAQKAATVAQAVKTTSDQATAAATAAEKTAATAKNEMTAADQKLQAARKKVMDLEKTLAADRQTVKDREKATADALARVEQLTMAAATAKDEAAAAARALEDARSKYHFTLQPVVGFSTDWSGPEAVDTIQKGTYMRWIPNMLQVPRNDVDWSLFVRTIQRENRGRFKEWVFWENPDLDDGPQSIPPERYGSMLTTFARWVKLYNPDARVMAGGFNFHKSLRYLKRVPDLEKLPFDEIHVLMNLAELAPEQADMEGYLDDMNAVLKIPNGKRTVRITELDWAIGKYVTPMQQAAYHARAALILESRGVPPHQFNLINAGYEFDGYGVFYRVSYGNTAELQTFLPYHVPKPAYFALVETRKFLSEWKYVTSVSPPDRSLAHNRAFVYRNAAGDLTAALWRAVEDNRTYKVPAAWAGAQARDVFGFPVGLEGGIVCTPLPLFLRLPKGYGLEQLLYDLRMLAAANGSYPVTLDLHLSEADTLKRAGYAATGKTKTIVHAGTIPGDRKVRETYVDGLETESFSFPLIQAGDMLLVRGWYFEGEGQKLFVKLNDGPEQEWTLTKGQGNDPGPRETTLVLRGCKVGDNRVAIRYDKPGNCCGYRVEPLSGDHVPLVRWGVLNSRQTRGVMLKHTSAVGTPLTFGKKPCDSGIGAHANSFIEYPLAGQFKAFEVKVGVDGSTEGRGSVVFRVFVDGKEKTSSKLMTGFDEPRTLRVEGLEGAQRLILSLTDADDGNRDDLGNWVDGKLYMK
jgi:hypothetical protein